MGTLLSELTHYETRLASLDLRHLVVRPPDAHPNEANGVLGVARELVLEQRAAGERAQLIMLAKSDVAADMTGLISDRDIPTQLIALEGFAFAKRIVWPRRRLVEKLVLNIDKTTVFHIHGGREPFSRGGGASPAPQGRTVRCYHSRALLTRLRCRRRVSGIADCSLSEACRRWHAARRTLRASTVVGGGTHPAPDRSSCPHRILGNGAYSARRHRLPTQPVARPPSASFPHFIYCGRYAIKHKGLDLLIEGSPGSKNSGSGRLTTIGTGPEREQLVHMVDRLESPMRWKWPDHCLARLAIRRCDRAISSSFVAF